MLDQSNSTEAKEAAPVDACAYAAAIGAMRIARIDAEVAALLADHPPPNFGIQAGDLEPIIIRWGNLSRRWSYKYQRVWVDVEKLQADFRLDIHGYVGLCGVGGIAGRYEGVDQFLTSGKGRLWMPEVYVHTQDAHRVVRFYDGRHRFAWMRDHGAQALPVEAPIGEAREISRLVGSKARICRVDGLWRCGGLQ